MPEQEPATTFHRLDYWGAMLGCIDSAKRLRAAYATTRDLTPYFLEALEEHARRRKQDKDKSPFRPGLGPTLLVRACETSMYCVQELFGEMEDVATWGSARRHEEADHADEAVLHRRDDVATWAVVEAEGYLSEMKEEIEASKQRAKKLATPADAFAKNLFQAWRDRVAMGETVDAETARNAAEEVVVLWEKMQDSQFYVNLDDDAEVTLSAEASDLRRAQRQRRQAVTAWFETAW